jgi:murein hydrolase activator
VRRCLPFALFVLILAAAPSSSSSQSVQPPPRSAAAIKERLQALKAESDALASQQRSLLIELRRLDIDRQLKATQIEETTSTLAGFDWSLQQTSQRIAQTEAALEAAKPAIRERIVRVYKLGRLGYTRLLLDLNDARTFQRTARVVSLLARRDRAELDRHAQLVTTLRAERGRVATERKTVEDLQNQLKGEQQALAASIAAQGARVKEIDERRDLNAQLVAELIAAQENLSQSVGRLTPTTALPGTRPAVGRYEWPLLGKIQTPFGRQQNRFGTQIARNGVEIAADAGSPVKAIDGGKVAFADVFSGFGQLVILDHGQKTYSLYGHLSTLAVQRGGAVERGQVVGSSGATPTGAPAVYFELRIDGKPVDPVQWLKR